MDSRRDSKFRQRGKWSQVQSLSSPIQFQYDLGLELSRPKNAAKTEVIGFSSNTFSCDMQPREDGISYRLHETYRLQDARLWLNAKPWVLLGIASSGEG